MDVTSLLLAEWALWLRATFAVTAGYLLCRRRSYGAVPVALLAAYWAYGSISIMVDFRSEVLEQAGLSYMIQAYVALLVPFGFMALGLLLRRERGGEPCAAPNGGPATQLDNSGVTERPPSVS